MINKMIEGDMQCGKGPSLAYGPAVHNKLLDIVLETVAEKNNIPVQMRAVSRSTGTDTDSFCLCQRRLPVCTYFHSLALYAYNGGNAAQKRY